MIRTYRDTDFSRCRDIVNHVWDFDARFPPQPLSDVFNTVYTGGSVAMSNFTVVIEEQHLVQGFLFGTCGDAPLYASASQRFWDMLKGVWHLLLVPGVPFRKKCSYVSMVREHERNRQTVDVTRANEVNLFAVDPSAQGQGYGKVLLHAYIKQCQALQVPRITLETDTSSNYGFYQHLGFTVKGVFSSRLQREYSGTSGETYVYELRL